MTKLKTANGTKVTTYEYDKYNRVITLTDPMGYSEHYEYDISGNMTNKTDKNGKEHTYTYDACNRLLNEKHGIEMTSYEYDMCGHMVEAYNGNSKILYSYDDMGNLITQKSIKDGKTFEVWVQRDLIGNITNHYVREYDKNNFLSILQNQKFIYDGNNNLLSVSDDSDRDDIYQTVANYTYDTNGNIAQETLKNGVTTTYEYYNFGFLKNKKIIKDSQTLAEYAYDYYTDGNVMTNTTTVKGKSGKTITYRYDDMDRLTEEKSVIGGSTSITNYAYDTSGNRLSMQTTGSVNSTAFYTYDDNNRLVTEKTSASPGYITKYNYDKNGNMTFKRSRKIGSNYSGDSVFGIYDPNLESVFNSTLQSIQASLS